jgi:uncharacterized coiled-coil DUF342 family protein
MPYKDPRLQINLKLTPANYAQLETEAALANTNVSQFARHLLEQRGTQPLSVQAQHERKQARQREAELRQQVRTLQRALQSVETERTQLLRQVHTLQGELDQANAELMDTTRLQALIRQQMAQQEQVVQAQEPLSQNAPEVTDIEVPSVGRRRARRRF